MFCPKCGCENFDSAVFCQACGNKFKVQKTSSEPKFDDTVNDYQNNSMTKINYQSNNNEVASAGWVWLGIANWVAALVLWLIFKNRKPALARKCKIGFIVGVSIYGAYLAFYLVYMFFVLVLMFL